MSIPEIAPGPEDSMARREKQILEFWRKNRIFEKSLKKKSSKGNFVFYEGPPTANGKPGIHHVLARVFKDLVPRYKTMRGYRVERKAGWDTHGLPVELEVEKLLGLKNKKDIEDYGIEKFNQKCRESVWKYKKDWEEMTERIGYWVDMENPYITYENNYIESLWWIIKQAYGKKLVYKGHKVVPQCPRCGTALSSHEVAQGYKNIQEESAYIKFKIKNRNGEYILAWTTTPWTLPGNIALAVGESIDYVKVEVSQEDIGASWGRYLFIMAKDLLGKVFNESGYKIVEEMKGRDLIGLEYEPLFKGVIKGDEPNAQNAFKIYPADFVSTEDGTGVVHTAVMYGVEDYDLGEKIGLPKIHTVNLDGTFNELVPQWKGKFVKDVEKEIIEDLKKREILYKTEQYRHDYPFCWRCDTPLIYYAKDSWYFNMSALRGNLIKNNEKISWIPDHIKEGRFGEWLREVKDWAISRERYWGTPIPIWICEKCKKIKAIGSREELGLDKNFDLHRPYIDDIKLECECGGEMRRIPEVMDCWFDSGAMPFAQFHYPFENKNFIDKNEKYPADFICEAIDQTRGWFYTLLAVSTILDKGTPYKNAICLGHILDKNGQKMSKHIGNVIDPWEMINRYGADVIRWYFYGVNQPGEPKRFDERGLRESGRMFITLLNVLAFYKMFSSERAGDITKRDLGSVLDKWIISRLNLLTDSVTEKLDKYDITTSVRILEEFINDLSIWYVRRSRDRFKKNNKKAVKTLGHVLLNLAKLIAPFVPFTGEYLYHELRGKKQSVHLEDWPKANKKLINKKLEEKMELVRQICNQALQKRVEAGIKVRQPLLELKAPCYKLEKQLVDLIKEEVNIKGVKFDSKLKEGVILNTVMTPQLEAEGKVRELVRQIQALRKELGLTPKNKIRVYFTDEKFKDIIKKNKAKIKKQVIAESINFDNAAKELRIEKV